MNLRETTTDTIEQELAGLEALIGRARSRQMTLLVEIDRRQTPTADGCRSLAEWVTGRLDVAPETAATLSRTARSLQDHPTVAATLEIAEISFDRAVELARLATIDPDTAIDGAWGWDVAGLRRFVAQRRRITRRDEQDVFDARHLVMQPSFGDTAWRLWGLLPAADGKVIDAALTKRADNLPTLPDGTCDTLTHRRVDALVAIAADSLDTTTTGSADSQTPIVSMFIDLDSTTGEAISATLESGLQVGPGALDEVLCDTRLQTIVVTDGQSLAAGRTTRTISPALRRAILHRDGHACAADGCTSRYRLQLHHRIPWSAGGPTNPENLVTLCWYHHHVVIHGMGYTIDPDSPPQRLRFRRPPGHDPP